jgi:hypothetical protein
MRGVRALVLTALVAPSIWAQPTDVSPAPQQPVLGLSATGQGSQHAFWAEAEPRWFFAATLELGFVYARPKLAVGRGRPHWQWAGIEALPIVTTEGAGFYGGTRLELPHFDARLGARYFSPFDRPFLPEQDSYERLDIERADGAPGRYAAYEAELTAHAPIPGGTLFAIGTGIYVPEITHRHHLYEDSLRVVMAPPFAWRGRLGYLFAFGPHDSIGVGAAAELIGLPGRGELVWRAGPVAVAIVSAALDVQASFLPVIASPDSIGLAGADFGHLGVRWRWATGAVPR